MISSTIVISIFSLIVATNILHTFYTLFDFHHFKSKLKIGTQIIWHDALNKFPQESEFITNQLYTGEVSQTFDSHIKIVHPTSLVSYISYQQLYLDGWQIQK